METENDARQLAVFSITFVSSFLLTFGHREGQLLLSCVPFDRAPDPRYKRVTTLQDGRILAAKTSVIVQIAKTFHLISFRWIKEVKSVKR